MLRYGLFFGHHDDMVTLINSSQWPHADRQQCQLQ